MRYAFHIASAVSLLLFVAAAVAGVAWYRSDVAYTVHEAPDPGAVHGFFITHGRLGYFRYAGDGTADQPNAHLTCRAAFMLFPEGWQSARPVDTSRSSHGFNVLGLEWNVSQFFLTPPNYPQMLGNNEIHQVLVPIWILLPLFAALPAWSLKRHRQLRLAQRHGWCESCSYDLAGNVSGRCPECGTALARKALAVG